MHFPASTSLWRRGEIAQRGGMVRHFRFFFSAGSLNLFIALGFYYFANKAQIWNPILSHLLETYIELGLPLPFSFCAATSTMKSHGSLKQHYDLHNVYKSYPKSGIVFKLIQTHRHGDFSISRTTSDWSDMQNRKRKIHVPNSHMRTRRDKWWERSRSASTRETIVT